MPSGCLPEGETGRASRSLCPDCDAAALAKKVAAREQAAR